MSFSIMSDLFSNIMWGRGIYGPISASQTIEFTVSNMPSHITLYPFLNKQSITDYVKPANGNYGDPIVTDGAGIASGTIINPSDPSFNAPAGVLEFQFGDSIDFDNSVNFATTQFTSGVNSVSLSRTENLLPSAGSTITDANRTDVAEWQVKNASIQPMAQVFFVNGEIYPYGVFIVSVDLYFYSKDTTKTVSIELRNIVNGVPSSTSVISESLVVKTPSQINVRPNLGQDAETFDKSYYTRFSFKKPLFLLPNQEYAVCIITESSKYSLYSGSVNNRKYGSTNRVTNNPNVRRLFKTGDYFNPDLDTDICIAVNVAEFSIGSESFDIVSKNTSKTDYYNKYRFNPATKVFSGVSNISYAIKTKRNGVFPASFDPFPSGHIVVLDSNRTANVSEDVKIQVTFSNQSRFVSPILDLEGTDFTVINDNPLSSSSAAVIPTNSSYVSKVYKVEEGLDFTGISVELSANKPAGTSLKVYCKLLGPGDQDIENNQWIELPRKADKASEVTDLLSYVKDVYQKLDGLTYTDNSVTYAEFKEFKIRVDFVSTNSAVTPSINKMVIRTV